MDDDRSLAIALATAWAAGELDAWTALAREAIGDDPLKVLREMSVIVAQLADAIAEKAGGNWTVNTVLQHLALDAEEDDGGSPESA